VTKFSRVQRCEHNYSIDRANGSFVQCPYCEENVAKVVAELSVSQLLFGTLVLCGVLLCLPRPEKS
jgi:hypothetical protein